MKVAMTYIDVDATGYSYRRNYTESNHIHQTSGMGTCDDEFRRLAAQPPDQLADLIASNPRKDAMP
jgi:hypothetical protein